jgi:hypothetical protein
LLSFTFITSQHPVVIVAQEPVNAEMQARLDAIVQAKVEARKKADATRVVPAPAEGNEAITDRVGI